MGGRERRVAVLDDDEDFSDLMQAILAEAGLRGIRLHADGDGAAEAVAAARADLLVLDLLGVATIGGLELLDRIRADPRCTALPVLICSADVQELRRSAAQLARLPRVAVLEKPFSVDVMTGTIERLLDDATLFPNEGGSPDPMATATLEAFLGRLGRNLRWAVVDAWVADRRPGLIRCAAAWVASVQLEPFAEISRRTRLPVGAGLPGRAWSSGRAAWIPDLTRDMNFPRLPVARRVNLVSAAAVPVIEGGAVLGVIAGYDTRLRRPDVAGLDRLRRFTEDAAPMLRSAAGLPAS